jgi:osmotically inducible protein OsmC
VTVTKTDGFGRETATESDVPDIDDTTFQELAQEAKENCPVSQALGALELTVQATLEG